jgi:hypothetical protein
MKYKSLIILLYSGYTLLVFLGIFVCSRSGYIIHKNIEEKVVHPSDDFVKSDYKLKEEVKTFNHPSIFWLRNSVFFGIFACSQGGYYSRQVVEKVTIIPRNV